MAEQKLSKSFVRFLKAVRGQRDLIDKIFGKTAQEQKAMEAITFGIIENGTQVWFTPKAYRAILMAVAKGEISIVPDASLGADAAYDDLNDRLRIPEALYSTPIGRGMIVHELTHAIVDMAPATNWTSLTNECAAFVAQAIYYKVTKTPLTHFAPYPDDVKLHGAARDLVDYYYFGDPVTMESYGGITRQDPPLEKLRRAVHVKYGMYTWEEKIDPTVFGLRSRVKIDVSPD